MYVMGLSKNKTGICVHGYESAWLNRWTRIDSNRDIKCSKKINLPEDGRASTGSMKLKNRGNSKDGDDEETSSPAIQTKNEEHFLNNNTKLLRECKRIWSDSENNSRAHVKRPKTNASDCNGNETKSMIIVEGPSGEKVNYFFDSIFGINKRGSRINKKPSISQIRNLSMGRGGEDVNPWIQRWCKKEVAETHEPAGKQKGNQKGTAIEKQFPSIAAMALMGKARCGLNPSGLRKTNSLFVWNAQDLRRKHSLF